MYSVRKSIGAAVLISLLVGLVWAAMLAAAPPSGASVTVTAPADGAVVSGTVTLRAELSVPKEIRAVVLHFFVGEADLGPVCPGHPEKEWNTMGWTDKSYQVIARVYRWDREKKAQGKELAASPPIQVVVDNSP